MGTPTLAENIDGGYTEVVKNLKFIHVLLVALLCFGQLASNIHAVGHLHAHHNHEPNRSVSLACGAVLSVLASATAIEHCRSHEPHASSSDSVENDCGIYHSYSGLNGVLYESAHAVIAQWSTSPGTIYAPPFATGSAVDGLQIRAPPAFS